MIDSSGNLKSNKYIHLKHMSNAFRTLLNLKRTPSMLEMSFIEKISFPIQKTEGWIETLVFLMCSM